MLKLKKSILISILVLIFASYASMQAIIFLKKMGIGGHRNKTCEDCHGTDFKIPACIQCHTPHDKNAAWKNSVCLACHNSPHVPNRNGSLSTDIPKENCAVCHSRVYGTLTFYNSKHNQLGSCANCHPVHREKKDCFGCHANGHTSHPFANNNCNACHGKVECKDCHKEPHAPLMGLPRITGEEQFNSYADTRRNY